MCPDTNYTQQGAVSWVMRYYMQYLRIPPPFCTKFEHFLFEV